MLGLFVRVHGRPEESVEGLRSRLQRAMPGASFVRVMPFQLIVDPTMRSWASGARMFSAFGALALALAAIGLYSVRAFAAGPRTRELGVRLALGARRGDVVRLVVRDGLRVTIAGVVIGGAIARVGGGAMKALLFRISPADPMTFALVAVMLIVVGILASAIPA